MAFLSWGRHHPALKAGLSRAAASICSPSVSDEHCHSATSPLHPRGSFYCCHTWFQGTPVYSSGLLFAQLPSLHMPRMADTSAPRAPTSTSSVYYSQCAILVSTSLSRGLRTPSRWKAGGGLPLSVQSLKHACSVQMVTDALLCQTRPLQRVRVTLAHSFPSFSARSAGSTALGPREVEHPLPSSRV